MKNGIVAFCGAKFSGKSTSAEILREFLPNQTEELAFAGHLKSAAASAFEVDSKYFLDPKFKEVELPTYVVLTRKNIETLFKLFDIGEMDYDKYVRPHVGQVFYTGRSLLQYVGTEVLHPIDPLIHVKVTLKNKDPNKVSIITDLRFPHEFSALKALEGFTSYYVHNIEAENAAAADTHASEQGWKVFKDQCTRLDNNSDIQNLRNQIKDIAEIQNAK